MYVAVRDVTLRQAGHETISAGLASLELNAVELAVGRDMSVALPDTLARGRRGHAGSDEGMGVCRRAYDEAGIHVSGLLLATNLNAADIGREVQWIVDSVRLARALGADAVRIDAAMTGQHELALDQRVAIYAQGVCRVLEATASLHIPIGIENHGLQGTDPRWLQSVLDMVGSDRLGLTLDTANYYWAGEPLDRVYAHAEHFASRVKHVHCKNISFEPDRRNTHREPGWGYGEHVCPIPDGDIDHGRIARVLAAAGYHGGLNIEDESLSKYEGDERRRQLRRGADHLAEIVQGLGGARRYPMP